MESMPSLPWCSISSSISRSKDQHAHLPNLAPPVRLERVNPTQSLKKNVKINESSWKSCLSSPNRTATLTRFGNVKCSGIKPWLKDINNGYGLSCFSQLFDKDNSDATFTHLLPLLKPKKIRIAEEDNCLVIKKSCISLLPLGQISDTCSPFSLAQIPFPQIKAKAVSETKAPVSTTPALNKPLLKLQLSCDPKERVSHVNLCLSLLHWHPQPPACSKKPPPPPPQT
ncbi:hypothetical protein VP01_2932g1 [Puccinia sorghi]|uniref:Uncharacterized protein n=1 Tax=Puccinia sorghi TaxID=27349 RepID=A0A0L6V175_9BASI|nr:hypothetical protein VP01_2932g1 [Puccinia sorghi]